MNTGENDKKDTAWLCDETYRRLVKDPTTEIEKEEIGIAPKEAEARGEITKEERLRLILQLSAPPQVFVHLYRLSKDHTRIIFLLAGHTSLHVKNSSPFTKLIQQTIHGEEDRMVSFDIESVYSGPYRSDEWSCS